MSLTLVLVMFGGIVAAYLCLAFCGDHRTAHARTTFIERIEPFVTTAAFSIGDDCDD